jgi:hypothetical protein
MRQVMVAVVAGLLTAGCVSEARIAMPSDLGTRTERIELTGMAAGETGRFRLAGAEGRFTRRAMAESRDGGFVERRYGGGTFEAAGADLGGQMGGRCHYGQEEIVTGTMSFVADRFAYRCRFSRDGRPIDGGLILAEVPARPGKLLSGRTRAGEMRIGDLVLGIVPIHRMEGGGLPSGTPLGYGFTLGDREIGAVDLNGLNKTVHAPRSGAEREAVLAGSLALAILWDPET